MSREMSRQRLNSGYVHARFYPRYTQDFWMSPEWLKLFRETVDETAKAGMHVSFTTGDPCFPAQRILDQHPELKAQSLGWKTIDVTNGEIVDIPESAFVVAAKLNGNSVENQILSSTLTMIGEGAPFSWNSPKKEQWRVYIFHYYHAVLPGGTAVNCLDRRLFNAWCEVELNLYDNVIRDFMGTTMKSVFFDHEGSFGYKLAWSKDLKKDYLSLKGRDIRLWMPLMIDEDAEGVWGKTRWDWFDVVTRLYTDVLLKPLNKWCLEREMSLTCHLWEESLFAQAMQVGSFFHAQRSYSMPGTDSLFLDIFNPREFKESQSVCEFEGKQLMCEVLGIAGWHLTPTTLKTATNSAIAWGITHIVPHGINSDSELENVSYPPDFFDINPYWRYFHHWTDFTRRTSYINDQGHLDADVLLISPMDSVWALLGDGVFDQNKPHDSYLIQKKHMKDASNSEMIEEIDTVYTQAITDLTEAHVEYMVTDSHYLGRMSVNSDGCLQLAPFLFKTVIIPPSVLMPLSMIKKIVEFAELGGYVYALGTLPNGSAENGMSDSMVFELMGKLKNTPNFIQIEPEQHLVDVIKSNPPSLKPGISFESGAFPILTSRRKIKHNGKSFIWLANNETSRQNFVINIRDTSGELSKWNCETGEISHIPSEDINGGCRVSMSLEACEGIWLVSNPEKAPCGKKNSSIRKNILSLDNSWFVQIAPDDQPYLAQHKLGAPDCLLKGAERPLEPWLKWNLRQFSGFVDYSTSFELESVDGSEVLDLGKVEYMAEVTINNISAGERLWPPFTFKIGHLLRSGQNDITVKVGNLVLNAVTQYKDYNWKWYQAPDDDQLDAGLFGPINILVAYQGGDLIF